MILRAVTINAGVASLTLRALREENDGVSFCLFLRPSMPCPALVAKTLLDRTREFGDRTPRLAAMRWRTDALRVCRSAGSGDLLHVAAHRLHLDETMIVMRIINDALQLWRQICDCQQLLKLNDTAVDLNDWPTWLEVGL